MSLAKKLSLQDDPSLESNVKNDYASDKLAGYFYKIANHEELFRIGRGLLLEVEKGIKNFAFTSTGYKNSQQRSILGLCCFFDQNSNYKIAIISDQLAHSVFGDMVDSSILNSYTLSGAEDIVKYKSFHHHFDFFDYAEFIKLYENQYYTKNFDQEVKNILDNYDLIFWDIPEMEKMKNSPHFHYRISQFYESMTIIVSQSSASGKQVDYVKKFFGNYNINLNGVLFDITTLPENGKRRKFLGIF